MSAFITYDRYLDSKPGVLNTDAVSHSMTLSAHDVPQFCPATHPVIS